MSLVPLVILLLGFFAASLVVLRHTLTRCVAQATGHLQTLSQETIGQREALHCQVEEAERQRQDLLAKTREDAQQLKAQAVAEADTARQQMLEQARAEADRVMEQAMKARDALLQEYAAQVEAKAVERACELIGAVLPHVLREAVHGRWLDELIEDGFIPDRLATQETVREAAVVSAFPLTPSQRTRLAARLQAAFGPSLKIHETVDLRIIAGLIVTAGHLVLDGSLASELREEARHVQRAA